MQKTGREPAISTDNLLTGNEPMLNVRQQNIAYLKFCLGKIKATGVLPVDDQTVQDIIEIITVTRCSVTDAVQALIIVLLEVRQKTSWLPMQDYAEIRPKVITDTIDYINSHTQQKHPDQNALMQALAKIKLPGSTRE